MADSDREDAPAGAQPGRRRKREAGHSSKSKRRAERGSSSDGVSDDSDLGQDNWTMLGDVWPVEQRPEYLRVKKNVNRRDFGQLLQFEKLFRERRKLEGKSDAMFGDDEAPPSKKFKAGRDNRLTEFHEASFQRLPVATQAAYWNLVPRRREHVYRAIPLQQCGAENQVNEMAVIRMHDRRAPVTLKMFFAKNYSRRPVQSAEAVDGDWESPIKLRALQEALLNHAAVSRSLWPMDFTPDVIGRILVVNNWGGAAGSEAARTGLIATFFDWLMVENAASAAKGLPPADYRRAKEIWERAVESAGIGHGDRSNKTDGADGDGKDKKKTTRGGGGGGASVQAQPRVAGMFVCYKFNDSQGCQRTPQGQGCKLATGQVFVHACTAKKTDGSWCLGNHSRQQHK